MSSLESSSRMNLTAGTTNALASTTNGITSTAVSVGTEGGVGGVPQTGNPAAAPAGDYKLYQQQTGGSTPAHQLPLHAIPLLNSLPHNPIYQQPMGMPAQPQQYRYYGDQYQYYQGAPASSATPAANGPSGPAPGPSAPAAPAGPAPSQYPYYMYNQQASYPYNYYQGQQPSAQPQHTQPGTQPGAQQSQPPRQVPPLQSGQAAPQASAPASNGNGASSTDTPHGAGAAHGGSGAHGGAHSGHGGPGAGAPPELALTVGQYQPPGIRPRVTTTMWEDEKTLCYQVDANNVLVVRRADNNMINGTKLLNVAQMTRGRRDGILKLEKVRHVVKIGLMHLKGVWIPFERALAMAQREGIVDLLYPLFVRDIKRVIQTGILPQKLSSMYYDQSQLGQQGLARQLSGSAPSAPQYAAGAGAGAGAQASHQEQGGAAPAQAQSQHGQPVYGYQQYYTPALGQYYAYNGYSYNNQAYPYQQYAKPKDEKDEKKE